MGARVVTEPRRWYGQTCLTGLACTNALGFRIVETPVSYYNIDKE